MFVYCPVEQAEEMHAKLRSLEEEMLQRCGLAYRVIDTAAGDLGTSAARKFDCRRGSPPRGTYRELTSTSNCTTLPGAPPEHSRAHPGHRGRGRQRA